MDLGIKGRVAMVAAASKGIGYAAAEALAAEGCKVSICSREKSAVEAAASNLGAIGFVCDVSKAEDLERWHAQTVKALGPVDILVTNTGGPPAGPVSQMTDEQWEAGFQSTLMNVVRLVRLAMPSMVERKWGRIVHVTSLVAKDSYRILPISSTLRTGLMSLTKLQAWEGATHGLTVNGVLPGHTATDRQTHLAEIRAKQEGISLETAMQKQAEGTAMKRFADPKEVAAAIAFLCSEPAAYISGVSLLVDGATTVAL